MMGERALLWQPYLVLPLVVRYPVSPLPSLPPSRPPPSLCAVAKHTYTHKERARERGRTIELSGLVSVLITNDDDDDRKRERKRERERERQREGERQRERELSPPPPLPFSFSPSFLPPTFPPSFIYQFFNLHGFFFGVRRGEMRDERGRQGGNVCVCYMQNDERERMFGGGQPPLLEVEEIDKEEWEGGREGGREGGDEKCTHMYG